jgi:DNA-binding NarL/FixJ family response regulator
VIYSADDDADVQRRALEAGAADFVSKNRAADDLLPAIRRAVQVGP